MSALPDDVLHALTQGATSIALFDAQGALRWSSVDAKVALALPRHSGRHDTPGGRTLWVAHTPLADGGALLVASDVTLLLRPAVASTPPANAPLEGAAAALRDMLSRRQSLSIAVVDVGDLNDAMLGHFMRHCRLHLRPGDTLGHLGGAEFLLLLPGAGSLAASAIVDRLHRRLVEVQPAEVGRALHDQFGAGIAPAKPGEAPEGLLKRAHRALDTARQRKAGTSRIVLDSGAPP